MIPVPRYFQSTVAIVGLGKSGLSAARALKAGGATVLVWDDKPDAREQAAQAGFAVVEPSRDAWRAVSKIIWSPGIPHTHPQPHPAADLARSMGIPLVCDVDLLCETKLDPFYVAITGTNGKSTTTTLIHHILSSAGHKTAVGGNLGTPALDLAPLEFTGTYVLELSSYQLELVPALQPSVSVWLNISPDHLGRHGGLDGYVAAKTRILQNRRQPSTVVIGVDDVPSAQVYDRLVRSEVGSIIPVRIGRPVPKGVYVVDGRLIDATGGRPKDICDLKPMKTLPGSHNWQNAACAYAAARARNVAVETIVAALRTFPGLAHRQQLVDSIEGVAFINDSKATNADAAARALACYDNILWIAGGQAKEGGIDSLAPLFPRIKHAFLIGEAMDAFAETLNGKVPFTLSRTLLAAVEKADEIADVGDTVLLSPACASWDQFRSFEHRGDEFARIVADLADDDDDEDDRDGNDRDGEDNTGALNTGSDRGGAA